LYSTTVEESNICVAQPRCISFSTDDGFTHAGRFVDDFRTICNPSVQVTFSGDVPSAIV